MKLPPFKRIQWNYLALAFAVPVIGILFVMLCGGYEPFGNSRSMLYSDMYHQYYPFFLDFRESIFFCACRTISSEFFGVSVNLAERMISSVER